jgi:hypothetical protein
MQSGGQGVRRITDQVFRDDGCDAAHDDCFTVLVLSPEATAESWLVHLLLEHTH